ncbi:MAG TPA: hypothetical protein VKS60_21995 [Stellaceae bacterium]|nr:hypothetical protein [Stellaceae bacterium]
MNEERLRTWRAEIEAELALAREKLRSCESDLAAAVAEEERRREERAELRLLEQKATLLGAQRAEPMASVLRRKFNEAVPGTAARAVSKQHVENAKYDVRDLEEALRQIDRALALPEPEEAPVVAEAPAPQEDPAISFPHGRRKALQSEAAE